MTSTLYVPATSTNNTPSLSKLTQFGAPAGAVGLYILANGTMYGNVIPDVILLAVYIRPCYSAEFYSTTITSPRSVPGAAFTILYPFISKAPPAA